MFYQPELRPGFFEEPIPEPRAMVKRLMLATAMLIDGYLDQSPARLHPSLANCFLAPDAGVIIAGTACRRPLMQREITGISKAVGQDAVVVRLPDEPVPGQATFDIYQFGAERMLQAYRLWMPRPTGAPWLIPTAGELQFVRLDPLGLDFVEVAPFSCDVDRYRGLKFGSEFLSVAVQGWF